MKPGGGYNSLVESKCVGRYIAIFLPKRYVTRRANSTANGQAVLSRGGTPLRRIGIFLPNRLSRDLVFQKTVMAVRSGLRPTKTAAARIGFESPVGDNLLIRRIIIRRERLEFVAANLVFVALGLVFVAQGLASVAPGFDFIAGT